MIDNKRRVVVAYRVVPGEPDHCVVVTTENLPADEHDSLMRVLESAAGQEANDFATVMGRSSTPDGRNMLAHLHKTGKMIKVPANKVELIPNRNTSIMLNELNELVAQQQGVTVADLAIKDPSSSNTPTNTAQPDQPANSETPAQTSEILSDSDLASQLRSQADAMFKEAKRLREQAEDLSPTKRTAKKKETAEESS